jgi:hypothetical protein
VGKVCYINLSFGPHYKTQIQADVVPMDAAHLILGRPWQYDNHVVYDGRAHTYTLHTKNKKVVVQPLRRTEASTKNTIICLPRVEFEEEVATAEFCFALEATAEFEEEVATAEFEEEVATSSLADRGNRGQV